jgi:4'-phosphopantetheinyl transferase EntD
MAAPLPRSAASGPRSDTLGGVVGLMDSVLPRVLPEGVAWAEAFDDPEDIVLFPEEEALHARAVDKRRREFTTGRHCARRALEALGVAPAPILRGAKGEPQWPAAVVGSITHCAGYRAAAVAPDESMAALGIDAEPHEPLPDGVLPTISRGAEPAHLRDLARRHPGLPWDRLLFCAKEAVYKAWFPLAWRWLGFEDAEVTIDPGTGDAGTFAARFLVPGPRLDGAELTGFAGRWHATDTLLAAAVTIPRSS